MGASVLEGVRVLDLSTRFPGPYGTQILADLGADVIMVEGPKGEPARSTTLSGTSSVFTSSHRNKRSVTIDLKSAEGVDLALRLARTCDVVVEGFRPGVIERLGLGYEAVRAVRPDIVYCSLTGYGQVGPHRDEGGHDINYLAAGGTLSFSAHWGQRPAKMGTPVADFAASLYLAIAILAALRGVAQTGEGAYIDLSMFDVSMALASPRAGNRLERTNSDQAHLWPTNDLFETADGGVVAVGAVEEQLWSNLRSVIGAIEPRLLESRFDTDAGRREYGDELHDLLVGTFKQRTAVEWEQLVTGLDCALTRVATIDEASRDETVHLRGLVEDADGVRYILLPFQWNSDQAATFRRGAPQQGEHTTEIIEELAVLESRLGDSQPG